MTRLSKFISTTVAVFAAAFSLCAQSADDILGNFTSKKENDEYKVRVTKNASGTYKGQIYWVKNSIDPATGKKILDAKNPDKSLRNTPCDQIVIFNGLKYNASKKQWDGGKIYDPQRGLVVNLTIRKLPDGNLSVKGSLMGISETFTWNRL